MKYLIMVAKWACTFLLLFFVFRNIDFAQTINILYSRTGLLILSCAVLIMILQTVIASLRLKAVLGLLEIRIRSLFAIKLGFIANFFAQILISFVGGDAMRLVSLVRSGKPYGQSARAIFLDRVLGFVSLQILYFIGMYFLLDHLHPGTLRWGILALGVISLLAIVAFFILGWMPQKLHQIKYIGKILDLAAISRYLYTAKLEAIYVLFLGFLVHLCNIAAIYMIYILLGGNVTFLDCFMIGIPVMYIAMFPFSIGGWGLRENSMIIGFAILGIASEISLSVSIILGLSLLIASIPGALLFWDRGEKITVKENVAINDAIANV